MNGKPAGDVDRQNQSLPAQPLTSKLLKRARAFLEVTVLLSALFASVLIIRELWPSPPGSRASQPTMALSVPSEELSLNGAPQQGSSTTAVMIIYSDFQCPFCKSFSRDTLPLIRDMYVNKGTLSLVFRNVPLEAVHPLAFVAAEAGQCAHRQGRFWQWHDALFDSSAAPDRAQLQRVSSLVGLDTREFDSCLGKGDSSEQIKREALEAQGLGIRGTPSFVLGTRRPGDAVKAVAILSGARQFREFKVAIDDLLERMETR